MGVVRVFAMRSIGLAFAVATALAITAGAAGVHAEDAQVMLVTASDFSAPALNGAPTTERRTLEWDAAKGRWGLSLGVEQRQVGRDLELKDVSPGVYYRLTRRLHIGGAVSLAPDQAETLRMGQPQAPAPRVRLETVFKF